MCLHKVFKCRAPRARQRGALAGAALLILLASLPRSGAALPSFASQTGLACAQCHTAAFGPALTPLGRQFKLNGYVLKAPGQDAMPLALMLQGGFSRTAAAQPQPPAAHFSDNDNLSLDQVALFAGTRLSEHVGVFSQATYSGEKRHFNWDNTDLRYARALRVAGVDTVVGISVNNNPTVQDLWNSTPAWGFPYLNSPLLPAPAASPVIEGALAQLVLGATGYAMLADHLYLEAGAYRGLSDRWLDNVGLYPAANPELAGAAPYWRAAYQHSAGDSYFSFGTFGLDVRMRAPAGAPGINRFTDTGFDGVYQYSDGAAGNLLVNASYVHEAQQLAAAFAAGASARPDNFLDLLRLDASYVFQQTWSAGAGVFATHGGSDATLFSPSPLGGSNSGAPDSRGYTLQLEWVPFGKLSSPGRPWLNARLGLQYTAYLRFNGGTANYDGFGRSASQNNSLFLFYWLAL